MVWGDKLQYMFEEYAKHVFTFTTVSASETQLK